MDKRTPWWSMVKTVLASFIGIRKSTDAHAMQKISPKVLILTAIGCGLCLVLLLVIVVNIIIYCAQS